MVSGRHEIRDFAFRFRQLRTELQPLVIVEHERDDIFWIDALQRVQSQVLVVQSDAHSAWSVYKSEARVRLLSGITWESLYKDGRDLVTVFRYLLIQHWTDIQAKDMVGSFESLKSTGKEQIVAPDGSVDSRPRILVFAW